MLWASGSLSNVVSIFRYIVQKVAEQILNMLSGIPGAKWLGITGTATAEELPPNVMSVKVRVPTRWDMSATANYYIFSEVSGWVTSRQNWWAIDVLTRPRTVRTVTEAELNDVTSPDDEMLVHVPIADGYGNSAPNTWSDTKFKAFEAVMLPDVFGGEEKEEVKQSATGGTRGGTRRRGAAATTGGTRGGTRRRGAAATTGGISFDTGDDTDVNIGPTPGMAPTAAPTFDVGPTPPMAPTSAPRPLTRRGPAPTQAPAPFRGPAPTPGPAPFSNYSSNVITSANVYRPPLGGNNVTNSIY